jgi:hypothetical protein
LYVSLNIQTSFRYATEEELTLDLGGYFQIVISVLMAGTFVTLMLIMLNGYYGEEKEPEKE